MVDAVEVRIAVGRGGGGSSVMSRVGGAELDWGLVG